MLRKTTILLGTFSLILVGSSGLAKDPDSTTPSATSSQNPEPTAQTKSPDDKNPAQGTPEIKKKTTFIFPNQATGASYDDFKSAFLKVWRKWELDDLGDNNDGPAPAIKILDPIKVYDLQANCNGKKLYLFDCDGTSVVDSNMNVRELGLIAAGTAGVRKILVGYDTSKQKLEVLLDDTILEFKGVEADQKECPNLLAMYSGFQFKNTKANSEYGLSQISYNKKEKKYIPSKFRTSKTSVELVKANAAEPADQ